MDHYLDLHVRPDPEFAPEPLMSALFSKLHRALVECHSTDIGISFPAVKPERPTLGNHLRLHGTSSALQHLMARPWLNGMMDHLLVGEVGAVPDGVAHIAVSRVQSKSSPARLARRRIRRHGTDPLPVSESHLTAAGAQLSLPYVSIRSRSTQQTFRLFIRHDEVVVPQNGLFGCYGLGCGTTVPWF